MNESGSYNKEFKNFFDNSYDLLSVIDIKKCFVKLNRAWETILGYQVETLRNTSFIELLHPEDQEVARRALNEIGKNFDEVTFEGRCQCENGSYRYYNWFCQEYHKLIIITAKDLTKRNELLNKLNEIEENAELLLNTIPCAVFSVDNKNIITDWNRRAEQITGFTKEEVIGNCCRTFAVEPCNEICSVQTESIPKPIFNKQATIRTKSGEILQVSKNIDVFRDNCGQVKGSIESFEDITERLKMEQLLKESEERYSAIVNNAPEIILIRKDDRIVFVNKAGIDASGYDFDELTGNSLLGFLTERTKKLVLEVMNSRRQGIHVGDYEIEFCTKLGAILYLNVKAIPITFDKEEAVLTVLVDITERKRYENALKRNEGILTAVALSTKRLLEERDYLNAVESCFEIIGRATEIDRISLFINEYDSEGNGYISKKIKWLSEAGEPPTDSLDLQSFSYKNILSFIEPLLKRKSIHGLVEVIENDYIREFLQSLNILSIVAIPIFVKNNFQGFISFDDCKYPRDWTEWEMSTLNTFTNSIGSAIERGQMEDELVKARINAEAANLMKSQFLANMSHEIRTPINGIFGFLELLRTTNLSEEQKDYLTEAKTASEMLLYLINDILDFSKIEAGKITIENDLFNLRSAIEEAVSLIIPKANEKGLDINLFIHPNVPEEVNGDSARLKQVVNNLLSNAVKFTEKGEVSVEVTGEEPQNGWAVICFTVTDTGIGMEKDVIKKLFTPFSQADSSTTRKFGGTGLGLAISKDIVKLLGGQILVDSNPGVGSVFQFDIKLKIIKSTVALTNLDIIHKKNILLIDEDRKRSQTIVAYLRAAGCNVYAADNAISGVAFILTNTQSNITTDLILIDSKLAEMEEFQLIQTMNQFASAGDIKKVLLIPPTVSCEKYTLEEHDIITSLSKPIRRDQLLNCMINVLGGYKEDDSYFQDEMPIMKLQTINPKILIVEDNMINRKLVVAFLKSHQLTCDIAENGQQALNAIMETDYEIVLMDCQMPLMDGYESTRRIRMFEQNKRHTTIIAMTANAMEGDREKCIDAGMDDYISKPIDYSLLLHMIEQYSRSMSLKYESFVKDRVKDFMRNFGLSEEEARNIYLEMKNDFPKISENLSSACRENNLKRMTEAVSQLQELAAILGMSYVYKIAKQIRASLANGDYDDCHNLISELDNLCRR